MAKTYVDQVDARVHGLVKAGGQLAGSGIQQRGQLAEPQLPGAGSHQRGDGCREHEALPEGRQQDHGESDGGSQRLGDATIARCGHRARRLGLICA